ncbi:MAG: hypothetical protein MJ144_05590, partial [Clostridia bacterium]|nr:hypothetical protein [Clostridia bacterium]
PAEEDDIEALLSEISFDDILEETGDEAEGIEEISLDELEAIEAEIGEEAPVEEVVEEVAEAVAEEKPADIPDEISFEGLEALFKDEA